MCGHSLAEWPRYRSSFWAYTNSENALAGDRADIAANLQLFQQQLDLGKDIFTAPWR